MKAINPPNIITPEMEAAIGNPVERFLGNISRGCWLREGVVGSICAADGQTGDGHCLAGAYISIREGNCS